MTTTPEPLRYRIETIRTSGNALDVIQAIQEIIKFRGLRPELVRLDHALDRVSLIEEVGVDGSASYEIELW